MFVNKHIMLRTTVILRKKFFLDKDKESREERRKRRKSRWGGSEHEKTFIPGMPTVLPTNLTPEQEKAYLCKYLIQDICVISRKDNFNNIDLAF
jgi:hypothetical protein